MAKKIKLQKYTWLIIATIVVIAIMVFTSGGGNLAKFAQPAMKVQPVPAPALVSSVDVVDASAGTMLTIFLQNTGSTKIPITATNAFPTTTWILKDSNGVARCSSNWNSAGPAKCIEGCGSTPIAVGEIHKVVLGLSDGCNMGSSDHGKVFSFTIDFSGKTTTTGSFVA